MAREHAPRHLLDVRARGGGLSDNPHYARHCTPNKRTAGQIAGHFCQSSIPLGLFDSDRASSRGNGTGRRLEDLHNVQASRTVRNGRGTSQDAVDEMLRFRLQGFLDERCGAHMSPAR